MKQSRSADLQSFIAAARPAFEHFVHCAEGRNAVAKVFRALESADAPTAASESWAPGHSLPETRRASVTSAGSMAADGPLLGARHASAAPTGSRLPVCSLLSEALATSVPHSSLRCLLDAFREAEPLLRWRLSGRDASTASENFQSGHANAMIVGPGGLEERSDIWIGVSLLAPAVRYPDHSHPPEEVYLVASDGEFRQCDGAWFTPGVGGTLYNSPGITHAMRSSNTPLLAFWILPVA